MDFPETSPLFETNRLVLRKFVDNDYKEVWVNWGNNPNNFKYIGMDVQKSEEDSRKLVERWVMEYGGKKPVFNWAIVLKENTADGKYTGTGTGTGPLIGMICFIQHRVSAESSSFSSSSWLYAENAWGIRYIIGEKWWNKGYTKEAVQCVVPFFLSVMEPRSQPLPSSPFSSSSPSPSSLSSSSSPPLLTPLSLWGGVADLNPASKRLMLGAGFYESDTVFTGHNTNWTMCRYPVGLGLLGVGGEAGRKKKKRK